MRGLIAETLIATSDVELPVSANARWSARPDQLEQLRQIADLGAPAAAAQSLGEAVAAAARADPFVGRPGAPPSGASSGSGVVTAGSFDQSVGALASPPSGCVGPTRRS